MQNRGAIIFGSLIILWGLISLFSNVFDLDFGQICFPTLLILVGVWLLFRPRLQVPGGMTIVPLSNVRRGGAWTVEDEEFLLFVGDIRLDMREAELRPGETTIKIYGFVGNVDVRVPQEVGVRVASTAFVTESDLFGRRRSTFVAGVYTDSDNYSSAERRLRIETFMFVCDLDVEQF